MLSNLSAMRRAPVEGDEDKQWSGRHELQKSFIPVLRNTATKKLLVLLRRSQHYS